MSRRTDIGKLLDSLNIDARQSGDSWKALCPNPDHDDRKVGSWSIVDDVSSDRHGLMHCWACSLGGDEVDLTKLVLSVGFHAALCWVEEYALPEGPTTARVEVLSPRVFRLPPGTVDEDLRRWPTPFRRYLAVRGVTEAQARRWGLAYALEGRLSGRVVIPARDASGRLLSYTARAIDRGVLRYLTPKREEGADPGAVFGEEHWGKGGTVVVTEAAFDALACERAVPEFAIAVTGTGGVSMAADPRVASKLRRFSSAIVVTDPDDAGDQAYEDLVTAMGGKPVLRARPPEGLDANKMDPDDLRGIIVEAE